MIGYSKQIRKVRRTLRAIALLATAVTMGFVGSAADKLMAAEADSRVLLLRNGHVVSGQIRYEGDYYRVTLAAGEVRVRAAEVDQLCLNLVDAFEVKHAAIAANDLLSLMRLAEWCTENGLVDQATALVEVGERMDPTHARVHLARRNLARGRDLAGDSLVIPELTPILKSDRADLDSLTRSMPEGTVETFRKTVQPMLLVGCAAAKCHGTAATNDFRLIRSRPGHVLSRRGTQRNLQAVLRWVDRERTDTSRVLMLALDGHGDAKVPAFENEESSRYRHLADWVSSVVSRPTNAELLPPIAQASQTVPRGGTLVALQALQRPHDWGGDAPTKTARRPGGQLPEAQVRDAWDPEIFNRQHHDQDESR